jgi:TolB-like protein
LASAEPAENLQFEGFRLDQRAGVLYRSRGGTTELPVALGERALRLLRLLAERQGEVVSKEKIITAVWPGRVVEEANINVQISKLRRILDEGREGSSCIQTHQGRGYCFIAPVSRSEAEGPHASHAVAAGSVQPRPHFSIVVLPFRDLSRDGRDQYLGDAITDDLTTSLSRVGDTFVISCGTALTYRDRPVDARRIGHELGVRYVVEGSVRRWGRRLRANAQLIDAEADQCLWAEWFEARVADLFKLQSEIATSIAGAIEPELLRSERSRVASRSKQLDGSYELYQMGLWHLYRYDRTSVGEAEALFRRALSIDPQSPQATALLAITLCNAAYLGWAGHAASNYLEAYELACRAVELDSRYPPAHFALGLVCMWTFRLDRAVSAFRHAIDLNPSYAAAHVLLGQMHLYRGDARGALRLAEKGIRLSPRDPRLFIWLPALSGAHYQLREYAQVIEPGLRSWNLNRNWPAGLRYAAAALGQLGRSAEGEAAALELQSLGQTLGFVEANLCRLYADQSAVQHVIDGLRKAGLRF